MSAKIALVLLSVSVLHVEVNCQCRPIGTNNDTEFTAVRDHRFYLNTAHPAPCSGNIIRWRYCYYRPATNGERFRVTWAVYRRMGSGNDTHYIRVGSSLRTVGRRGDQIPSANEGNFWCREVNVRTDFQTEVGDIVGACIYDPQDNNRVRKQLDIVGQANGYSLIQMNDVSDCSDNSMPSNISSSQLSTIDSRILHLYATITNPIPTTSPPTTMSTTEQTTSVTWSTSFPSDTTTADMTTTTDMTTTADVTTAADTTTTPDTTTTTVDDITSIATKATDTMMIESTTDDAASTITVAQISAQNSGTPVIIGVTVIVALLVVTGIAVLIIMLVIFKKCGKSVGAYSPPDKQPQSNGTVKITPDGVDNLTYDVGFHNPGALDSSFSLYDDVANAVSVNTGEGSNYYQLAESSFSNTYESVAAGGIYSELSAAHTMDTQVQANDQNPSGGISCYELEYYYSSPEDSKECLSFLLERNKQEDIYGNLDAYYAPASNEDEIYSQLQSCGTNNIPHNQIRIIDHLGSGQFGNVEKGTWQSKEVALKTLKTGSIEEDKVKFLQEAAIMAQFKHPNIVILHGVVSDKEPLMLVVELMHRGDLRDHLHSMRPDPGELPMDGLPEILLRLSQHVALGMQYLSGKGFVHRDLAARNILVSKDNICKVADFGMSRDLADETYYISHGGMIPVKWTAPEALHYKKYSTASDVWSYGCLLYEIWSLGYKPFEGTPNVEVVRIIDSNKRLSPPPGCPRMIYELMIKCWDPHAGSRPRFRELVIVLAGNHQEVLSIPQEALDAHKLTGVLGSSLEVGKGMYSDLQNKYCSENNIYE